MSANWNRCVRRAERIAKNHRFSLALEHGNATCGVTYKITFTSEGKGFTHELRNLSPSLLFAELSAFDWGLEMARFIYEPLTERETEVLESSHAHS